MVFNVAVSFRKLVNSKDFKYSMMIANTILIKENENEVLTGDLSCEFDDISY